MDCRYLYPIVEKFRADYGPKLTIGQAALSEMRRHYPIKRFGEGWDAFMRQWYRGGLVWCKAGAGLFEGDYTVNDINSSYPNVMVKYKHPIGEFGDYTMRVGEPNEHTCFIDLECDNHCGLVATAPDGSTSIEVPSGNFKTTIHEYNVALKYNLISNVRINYCIDCTERTDFSEFILPLYERRQEIKLKMSIMKHQGQENTPEWFELKRDSILLKLIMNNGYGKTGQNPRFFMEHYLTDPGERPPDAWFKSLAATPDKMLSEPREYYEGGPNIATATYDIWAKPAPRRGYQNVGVAASVTGAARAVLVEAIQQARDVIYCDTDSLICTGLSGVDIDPARLGAWTLEERTPRVVIAGKKLYGIWHDPPKIRTPGDLKIGLSPDFSIKSKGIARGAMSWGELIGMLAPDAPGVIKKAFAPTLDRTGSQCYIKRTVRRTAPIRERA
jgi:DNA polymerase elongation subunit (family B)